MISSSKKCLPSSTPSKAPLFTVKIQSLACPVISNLPFVDSWQFGVAAKDKDSVWRWSSASEPGVAQEERRKLSHLEKEARKPKKMASKIATLALILSFSGSSVTGLEVTATSGQGRVVVRWQPFFWLMLPRDDCPPKYGCSFGKSPNSR